MMKESKYNLFNDYDSFCQNFIIVPSGVVNHGLLPFDSTMTSKALITWISLKNNNF